MLAPVAVPAATANLTAAAGGRAVAGVACLEEVCSRRKNEVICGACTAAVKAVVEEAKVLAAVFCSPCAFMLLEVSMRGASPHADVVCVCDAHGADDVCITPVIKKEGARECMRPNLRGVLSYVARVINRWFVRNAQNYHRGVVFCGGCGFLCGCVILCSLRYALSHNRVR